MGSGSIQIPDKDIMVSHISIFNQPDFFGIKFPRETAKISNVRLFDPELKEFVGPIIKWQGDTSNDLVQSINIKPGDSGRLFIFAKERHSDEYFILNTKSLNSNLLNPIVRYKKRRKEFTVVLTDEIGRKYNFDIIVRHRDQSVSIRSKITFASRIQMIKKGFKQIFRAFKLHT